MQFSKLARGNRWEETKYSYNINVVTIPQPSIVQINFEERDKNDFKWNELNIIQWKNQNSKQKAIKFK